MALGGGEDAAAQDRSLQPVQQADVCESRAEPNVSNLQLNPDGSVRNLNGFGVINSHAECRPRVRGTLCPPRHADGVLENGREVGSADEENDSGNRCGIGGDRGGGLLTLTLVGQSAPPQGGDEFQQTVAPVLSKNCVRVPQRSSAGREAEPRAVPRCTRGIAAAGGLAEGARQGQRRDRCRRARWRRCLRRIVAAVTGWIQKIPGIAERVA